MIISIIIRLVIAFGGLAVLTWLFFRDFYRKTGFIKRKNTLYSLERGKNRQLL